MPEKRELLYHKLPPSQPPAVFPFRFLPGLGGSILVGPKAYPVFILCLVLFRFAASSKSIIMPYTLFALERSDLFRRFSKYGSPPGPHAFGAREIRIPGAIAGGWICLSGAKWVCPVWLCTLRITFPCFRAAILHTIMPDIDKTFYGMPYAGIPECLIRPYRPLPARSSQTSWINSRKKFQKIPECLFLEMPYT